MHRPMYGPNRHLDDDGGDSCASHNYCDRAVRCFHGDGDGTLNERCKDRTSFRDARLRYGDGGDHLRGDALHRDGDGHLHHNGVRRRSDALLRRRGSWFIR